MIMTRSFIRHSTMLACGLTVLAANAQAQVSDRYRFSYVSASSGIDASLTASVSTSGSLIGVYDAVDNPTGTRTKPGIFGTFGSTENVAVPVRELGVLAQGPVEAGTAGSFDLRLDVAAGLASIEALSIETVAGDTIDVPFSVTLLTDAFRTRNPTATYPSIPLQIPLGSVSVTRLAFTQAGPSVGTITAADGGYQLSVTVPVTFAFTGRVLDQVIEIDQGTIIPLPFNGTVSFTDAGAEYAAQTPLDFEQSQAPAQALPEIPLSLPTTTNGVTADVAATLVLDEISASIIGSLVSEAVGSPVLTECSADFNQDGGVDGGDVVDFFVAWEAGDEAADVSQDGGIDGVDVAAFFEAWEQGC